MEITRGSTRCALARQAIASTGQKTRIDVLECIGKPRLLHSLGRGGITETQGNVPFFLMGRLNTLSPAVTYSVCRSGPPKTTFEGSLLSGLLRMPTVRPAGSAIWIPSLVATYMKPSASTVIPSAPLRSGPLSTSSGISSRKNGTPFLSDPLGSTEKDQIQRLNVSATM